MGLFDLLFGSRKPSNVEVVPDRIWMTTQAKFAGLTKEARIRSQSETVAILLVAHFPDVLARLEEIAEKNSWEVPCQAVLAGNLNTDLASSLRLDDSCIIDIIVGERHPLPSVDDNLHAFANELSCRCRFSHHMSLDDAVMKVFAGAWVKDILKQLGMTEEEAIESSMVSRRIRQAQQKIEGRTFGSQQAESAAQWLEKNVPDLLQK
ncbi:MAG: hypothetical protein KDA78_07330 [Planctomycetaceae bacterium]|nr:hypothetical protein [Planctomycetaceae bacterium]